MKSIDPARVLEKLSGSKRRPVWMGYISPVDLLIDQQPSQASELEQLLNAWLEHTAIFLQARELEPNDTRLIKLSHLDPGITGRPPATPAELPLPLQLYLQRRHDVLQRYADLEGQADLLGRQPEFTLPVARLSNSDWQALLLQAWETQALLPELQNKQEALQRKVVQLEPLQAELQAARDQLSEAREEADLTLLQLHQVQEEQGAKILVLEAEAVQLRRARGGRWPRAAGPECGRSPAAAVEPGGGSHRGPRRSRSHPAAVASGAGGARAILPAIPFC
ncbi:MAG: hypothetical protein NTV57_18285 [Cyanobacteria bacterium]|nr:hypothetical protein [Cyanobacteriota bacterium]